MTEHKTTAVHNGKYYHHFGIRPITASIYGDKESDIENLTMIFSEDQTPPEPNSQKKNIVDYWGWYDNKEKSIGLIYPQRFLLDMCFPSGMETLEKRGEGKAYRLKIKQEEKT